MIWKMDIIVIAIPNSTCQNSRADKYGIARLKLTRNTKRSPKIPVTRNVIRRRTFHIFLWMETVIFFFLESNKLREYISIIHTAIGMKKYLVSTMLCWLVVDASVSSWNCDLSSGASWERSQMPSPSVSTYLLQSPGKGSSTNPNGQSFHASATDEMIGIPMMRATNKIRMSFLWCDVFFFFMLSSQRW